MSYRGDFMSKKCPKCGKENEDVASFCANCGYSFNSEFNKEENSDDISISIERNGFKSTFRLPSLKIILLVLALILIIGLIAFSFNGHVDTGSADSKNINLIKEKLYGYAYKSDGKEYYSYYLEGVIKNLPNNINDYDLRGTFYDEDGRYIYEDQGYLEYIKESSDKSTPTILASCYTEDLRNLGYVQLELKDPNGDIVLNETIYYDMDKMDRSGLKENL